MGDPRTVIALKHQTARHYIVIGLGLTLEVTLDSGFQRKYA